MGNVRTIPRDCFLNPNFDMASFFPKTIFENPKYKHAITCEKTNTTVDCAISGVIEEAK